MNGKQFIRTTLASCTSAILLGALSSTIVQAQTPIDNLAEFRSAALSKHNSYRAMHSSPTMTLSESLNSSAQNWANQIASTGAFAHSTNRGNVGENLYVLYTTENSVSSAALGNNAVTEWYNEISSYNFSSPGFSSETGHFTQVIWKSSTELGCGAAKGTETIDGTAYSAFYIVCHYAPAGNVQGQFPANVLPKS